MLGASLNSKLPFLSRRLVCKKSEVLTGTASWKRQLKIPPLPAGVPQACGRGGGETRPSLPFSSLRFLPEMDGSASSW